MRIYLLATGLNGFGLIDLSSLFLILLNGFKVSERVVHRLSLLVDIVQVDL